MLATATLYACHVVYSDGRLYQNHYLIGQYATEAAAKAQATRRHKAQRAERAAEHHQRIIAIWSRKA